MTSSSLFDPPTSRDIAEDLVWGITKHPSHAALDVGEFRHANGLHIGDRPDSTQADLELHARLLTEEVSEFAIAVRERDPHEILDAISDVIYVAYGAALDCGYDADRALRIVHAANMRKLGPDGKPIIDEHGKIRKPEGWRPPDLTSIVEAA
ncbi:MAG: hypothetical protein ACK5LO_02415 [Leucobacter sp.]